jgi:DNA (cytosine-5)-methyltransferase 1
VLRYKAIPNEGEGRFQLAERRPELTPRCWLDKKTGSTDVFGRLWWDRPSSTIRTEFFKPEKGRYLHPSEHRPITVREAARCMTFPDDFTFPEPEQSMTSVARQIGNAVPPLLASTIAEQVVTCLGSRSAVGAPA